MSTPFRFPPILLEAQQLRSGGFFRLMLQAAAVGVGGGAVIGFFRLCCDWSHNIITELLQDGNIWTWQGAAIIAGTLLVLALTAGYIVRREPLLSGSGIPQVELAVAGHLPLHWGRILAGKFMGTWIALTGGLSLGREGPCIQMGAAVGSRIGQFWDSTGPRFLIGGSVAGLSAAFSAPLGGMFFAFEEMKAILSVPLLLFTSVAVLTSWAVVDGFMGFGLVFPFHDIIPLRWTQLWLGIMLGVVMGVLGAGYNAGMMGLTHAADRQHWLPGWLRSAIPFACSGALLYLYPTVLAGMGPTTPELADGAVPLRALGLLLAVKVAYSILCTASGVAGGILMPLLLIGGMAGACATPLLVDIGAVETTQGTAIFLMGMAGFFAASVRSPLTGAALVTEMGGAWNCAPEMLLVSITATIVANNMNSLPIYDSLRTRIMRARAKDPQYAPAGPPKPPPSLPA